VTAVLVDGLTEVTAEDVVVETELMTVCVPLGVPDVPVPVVEGMDVTTVVVAFGVPVTVGTDMTTVVSSLGIPVVPVPVAKGI